jgi:hypothetical protein
MHVSRAARAILFVCTISCLAACASKQDKRMIDFRSQGSRLSVKALGCVNLGQVSPLHSPRELFPGVRDCIYREDYARAARLYGLAGLYGRIDVMRVEDPTAHEVISVLIQRNLGGFPQEQLDRVQQEIARLADDKRAMDEICNEVRAIGPPVYYPAYMIDYGTDESIRQPIRPGFDLESVWADSLYEFLKCS